MTWIDLRIGISMAERGVLGGVLMVIECWVGTHLLTTLLQHELCKHLLLF